MSAVVPNSLKLFERQTTLTKKIDLRECSRPYSEYCQMIAKNDIEAVLEWLKEYEDKKNTYKAYKREAVRFLLWCMYEQGKSLGDLKKEDLQAYFLFLQGPPPHWCGPQVRSNESKKNKEKKQWKPFKGPLSQSAFMTSVRILNSLLNYLVECEYLRKNPIKLIKKYAKFFIERAERKHKLRARILKSDEWKAVLRALVTMPQGNQKEIYNKIRTVFLFELLYHLGLRIHEVANHTWGSFFEEREQWWFFVTGKGNKEGDVPVNHEELLTFIQFYRQHFNKTPFPKEGDPEALLVSTKTKRPLKITQLYYLVKAIGNEAAKYFPDDAAKQCKLKALSPHWLRHLSASHQGRLGIPLTMIRDNLRHKSIETTLLYDHTEDDERFNQMQKMKMNMVLPLMEEMKNVSGMEYRLTLSKGPINKVVGLSRLLMGIEQQIFKAFKWMYKGETRETLLEKIKKEGVEYTPIEVVYQVKDKEVVEHPKIWGEALKRQSEVWLFECQVQVLEIRGS